MKRNIYNFAFYKDRNEETEVSAKKVFSCFINELEIKSAIDFGCGVGTWLNVLNTIEGGKLTLLGLDGEYVPREFIVIDQSKFVPTDLSKPIIVDRKYDLAISLEVAEHLPKSRSESFVRDLCKASDVVLFSAATLQQGGDGHVNEQRLSFWKSFFDENGYTLFDIIRPQIWNDDDIPVWYRQNIVLFVNNERSDLIEKIKKTDCYSLIDVIHPDLFETRSRIAQYPIVRIMYCIRSFFVGLKKRLRKIYAR